ncbi:ATP-binding protein [Candidatus Nitrospira salsa]
MKTSEICVLIIDDSSEDREVLRRHLSKSPQRNIRIIESDSSDEGWELCQTEHPDCILIDYQIPDADGLEFISLLNQNEQSQNIPVLMLTGQGDETVASEALKSGAADYLVKGKITAEGIVGAVTRAIEKAALIRKTEQQHLEIERSQQELEQFTHRASHDLQAPVRRIITFLELLQKELNGNLSDRSQDYIARSLKSAYHMRRLIKALLDYSLLGGAAKPFVSVNLNQVVQEALTQLEQSIQETQANITVASLPTMMGNELFLQQLFQNLIGNALKFRSEKPPRIQIFASDIGTKWNITVSDNGVGIPGDATEKIFAVFQRLDNGSKTDGLGIGLALCKKVMEMHGGSIWVDSVEGEGSKFCMTFLKAVSPETKAPSCLGRVDAFPHAR